MFSILLFFRPVPSFMGSCIFQVKSSLFPPDKSSLYCAHWATCAQKSSTPSKQVIQEEISQAKKTADRSYPSQVNSTQSIVKIRNLKGNCRCRWWWWWKSSHTASWRCTLALYFSQGKKISSCSWRNWSIAWSDVYPCWRHLTLYSIALTKTVESY